MPFFRTLVSATFAVVLLSPPMALGQATVTGNGNCGKGFAQVIAIGQVRIDNRCGLPDSFAREIRDSLLRAQQDQNLSLAQMQSLAAATNIMLDTVLGRMDRLESKAEPGKGQATGGREISTNEPQESFAALGQNMRKLIEKGFATQFKTDPKTDVVEKARQWRKGYESLLNKWTAPAGSSPRDEEVRQAIAVLDLDKALRLLNALIAEQSKGEEFAATRYSRRAQVYQLQFNHLKAGPDLLNALLERDTSPIDQGMTAASHIARGEFYTRNRRFNEAEAAFNKAVLILRTLARDKPGYLSDLAVALSDLGKLYYTTQRFKEAEAASGDALDIRRALARDNPTTYLPALAASLNDQGNVYNTTRRFKEAEASFSEAVDIHRALARDNPTTYLPALAASLNNQGILYFITRRIKESEATLSEARDIYRALAQNKPDAYQANLAKSLTNLGCLYDLSQRFKEAEASYDEAAALQRTLYQTHPAAYGPALKVILNNLAQLYAHQNRLQEQAAMKAEIAAVNETLSQSPAK